MDSTTIAWIAVGLLAIFYILVAFFSSKTWQVLHVVLTTMVFFAAGVFVIFAAMILKTHAVWRPIHDKHLVWIEQEEARHEQLLRGNTSDPEDMTESIRSVDGQLRDILYDRGRVWRGVTPTTIGDAAPTIVTLTMPAPTNAPADDVVPADDADPAAEPADDAAADDAPAPAGPDHHIEPKMVLYAFKEGSAGDAWKITGEYLDDTEVNWSVPVAFLGEFRVTAATASSVTMAATIPLTATQKGKLQGGTWVLYETMPIDTHRVFEGAEDERITALFPANSLPPNRRDAVIRAYTHHMQTAEPGSDPAERIWKRVKFTQNHKVLKSEVDAGDEPALFPPRSFDSQGRALSARFWHGEDIEFEIGDTVVFDLKTAGDLIAAGVAEEEEAIYVRPLRDYASDFHEIRRRDILLQTANAEVLRNTQSVQDTTAKANDQVAYRQQEKAKLTTDMAGLKRERAALETTRASFQQAADKLFGSGGQPGLLYQLFITNNRLASQLEQLQKQWAEEINRQVGAASAP